MTRFRHKISCLAAILLVPLLSLSSARGAGVQLSPEQQTAVDKLKTKGGSVMQLAADSDGLVVNLGLAGKQVGDEELALVKGLPKVVELDLHGAAITDAGLANVEGLKDLTKLRLDHTAVGDAGLTHLKGLSNLYYLNLYETAVTDAGLESLKGMKGLKRIYLWQSKVTDGGADALRKALPEAMVNKGEGMAALAAVTPTPPADMKKPETTKTEVKKPEVKKPDEKKPDAKKPDAATSTSTGPFAVDEEGFIRNWLVLGPIAPADVNSVPAELDREQIKGEKDLKPKEGDKAKVGDKELTWKSVTAKEYNIDLAAVFPENNQNVSAYVVAYLDSPDEKKDLTLLMGSNDHGRVYLNGKDVLKVTASRAIEKDQDKAAGVALAKGTNVIVFKIINEAGGWAGCIRFTDKDGKPVKDVKVKTGA